MPAVWDWLITSRKRLRCEDTRGTWSEQDVSPNLSILALFLAVYSSLALSVYRLKCIIWKYKRPLHLRWRSKRQISATLNCVIGGWGAVQRCSRLTVDLLVFQTVNVQMCLMFPPSSASLRAEEQQLPLKSTSKPFPLLTPALTLF